MNKKPTPRRPMRHQAMPKSEGWDGYTNQPLPREVTKEPRKRGLSMELELWYKIAREVFRPLLEEIRKMSAETQAAIDDMRAAVEANTSVTQSAVTLIQQMAQQIEDAADDPEEIRALAQSMRDNSAALSAAIPANTPAEPGNATGDQTQSSDTGLTDTGTSTDEGDEAPIEPSA